MEVTYEQFVRHLKIGRKGNSAYVSIPKPILESLDLHKGDSVEMGVSEGYAYFRKEDDLTLAELLSTVPENYAQLTKNEGWSESEIEEGWS